MTRVRFPLVPSIPILSELWEYNIRTYVRIANKPGIYFFTLESDNPLATWVARTFFSLPYHTAKMNVQMNDQGLHLKSTRKHWHSELVVEKSPTTARDRDFDIWATERYSLFNDLDLRARKAHRMERKFSRIRPRRFCVSSALGKLQQVTRCEF
jgi:uncharacterized protein